MVYPSLYLFATVLALMPRCALAQADFFILTQAKGIALARIDPIVNPGVVGSHVHNIIGASNFNTNLNSPQEQEGATCSSIIVGDDKSNYWAPALYWQFPNGTLQPMLGGNRIYYFLKGTNVKPFPKGLRMISGTAMSRDRSSRKTLGVKISCNHGLQTQDLPTQACGSIALGIFFPSCGKADGSVSSEDNFSHMSWPISFSGSESFEDPNGETCPPDYPIKYPTIFFEANYYPSDGQVWEDGTRYVLSNGDVEGPSYHADFVDGWSGTVLQEAIGQCGGYGRGPADRPEDCAPLGRSVDADAARACRYEGKIPNEDVGLYRPIARLPGCNPIWEKGVDTKPKCSVPQPAPQMVWPNVQFTNLWQRTHLPLPFVGTNSTDPAELKYFYNPSLGSIGASYLSPWGDDGSNKDKLQKSTALQLLQAIPDRGAGNGVGAAPSAASSSTSAASSATSNAETSTSSAANPTGVNAIAVGASSQSTSSSATTSTSSMAAASSVVSSAEAVTITTTLTSSSLSSASTAAVSEVSSTTYTTVGSALVLPTSAPSAAVPVLSGIANLHSHNGTKSCRQVSRAVTYERGLTPKHRRKKRRNLARKANLEPHIQRKRTKTKSGLHSGL